MFSIVYHVFYWNLTLILKCVEKLVDERELGERGKTLEAVYLGVIIDYIRHKGERDVLEKVRSLARRPVRLWQRSGRGEYKGREYLWIATVRTITWFTNLKITKMIREKFLSYFCIYIFWLHVYTCTICMSVLNHHMRVLGIEHCFSAGITSSLNCQANFPHPLFGGELHRKRK